MANIINYKERRPVWNGLGTDISHCTTVDEALHDSGLDFDVYQTDIVTDELYPIPLNGFKANVKDDGTPLGIVSSKYSVVQNRDAFSFLNDLAAEGMKFERAGGLQSGRKVFILARMPDRYIISGESITGYTVFINSFDGSGAVKILMTPVRMICLNMLNLALRKTLRSWSAVHCGDVTGKLEDAKNTLIYADRYMHELGAAIEDMKHQTITDTKVIELTDALYPTNDKMTDIQLRNVNQQRSDLLERYFHAPDLETMKKTAYRFINAVSDHATHAAPIRRRENSDESLFIRSVEGNPLVDRAFNLLSAAA